MKPRNGIRDGWEVLDNLETPQEMFYSVPFIVSQEQRLAKIICVQNEKNLISPKLSRFVRKGPWDAGFGHD